MESSVFLSSVFLLLMLISSATPTEEVPSRNQDLVAATKEMQKANYFTFVMLINMSPPDDTRLEGNVTFLMPNDRMLANMVLQQGSISGFLLQHSIPSPLLFDTLKQFPTGTTIPSSLPNCMLKISNNGRKDFALNNVKIVSPNICVEGSSIRCHGIDGVLSEDCVSSSSVNNSSVPPPLLPPCPNGTDASSCRALPPIPSPSIPSAPPTPTSDNNNSPPPALTAPSPIDASVGPVKSGSTHMISLYGSLDFVACFLLSLIGIYL